jgi:hypothetical protein
MNRAQMNWQQIPIAEAAGYVIDEDIFRDIS